MLPMISTMSLVEGKYQWSGQHLRFVVVWVDFKNVDLLILLNLIVLQVYSFYGRQIATCIIVVVSVKLHG